MKTIKHKMYLISKFLISQMIHLYILREKVIIFKVAHMILSDFKSF